MQKIDVVTEAVLSQCEFDFTWLAAALIKSARSRSISSSELSSKSMQIVAGCPQTNGNFLVIIRVGKRVLGRLFLTGKGNFAKVEWTSATFLWNRSSCVSNSGRNVQITALRYTGPEKRTVEIHSLQCIGKILCRL